MIWQFDLHIVSYNPHFNEGGLQEIMFKASSKLQPQNLD